MFVFAVVVVVFCEHFAEFFGEFVWLVTVGGVVLAALMVADAETGSAAIAEFKGFDRIGGVLCDFFVENSYRTVQIVRHVILRWG
jgi:hypothetical protein